MDELDYKYKIAKLEFRLGLYQFIVWALLSVLYVGFVFLDWRF